MDRTVRRKAQQRCKQISQHAGKHAAVDFFNVLAAPELLAKTEEHLPEYRERLYPPTVALAMFIKQALSEDRSCQNAVNGWAAQRAAESLEVRWVGTSGYCQARQRLPLEMVKSLAHEVGRLLSQRAPMGWHWHTRRVKLVDGTGISMPDTPANRRRYPQLSSQAAGVGFPIARLVTVICLSTGAVLEAEMGPFEGRGHSELDLFRTLLGAFAPGEVMLADALYCNYFLIAALQRAGVEVVFEQHGSRNTDFHLGEKLGKRHHRVYWSRPKRPQWMSPEEYAAVPEELCVRELQTGGRVLVTTLLNPRAVCKRALARQQPIWPVSLPGIGEPCAVVKFVGILRGSDFFRHQIPCARIELGEFKLTHNSSI